MSKADEMFSNLGYKDLTNNIGACCICLFGKEDKRIGFYVDKTFDIYNYYDGQEYGTMQELQAINEKVKELGWLE